MSPANDRESSASSQRAATALMAVGALTIWFAPALIAELLGAGQFVGGTLLIVGFLVMIALLGSVPSGTKIP